MSLDEHVMCLRTMTVWRRRLVRAGKICSGISDYGGGVLGLEGTGAVRSIS